MVRVSLFSAPDGGQQEEEEEEEEKVQQQQRNLLLLLMLLSNHSPSQPAMQDGQTKEEEELTFRTCVYLH
jgi:hypothetical protein